MNNKRSFFTGILTGLVMAIIVVAATFAGRILFNFAINGHVSQERSSETTAIGSDTLTKVKFIEDLIKKNYALDMVDDEKLENGIYSGLVEALGDPYSRYYSAEEMKAQQQHLDGVYYGIGCYVSIDEESGYARVGELFEDSPALKAGLKSGDLLIAVDGEDTRNKALEDVVALVRGEEGTTVELTVRRKSEGGVEDLNISVKRGTVPKQTVSSKLRDDGIAVVRISEFDLVTVDQFTDALATMKGQGMKAMILDLRGNPGGNFSASVDVARKILPEGIVTYTLEKSGDRQDYTCDGKNELDVPLAVLVDSSSASASEIVAGAIKDHNKGILVGTTTFGKGIVQRYISLTDGSAVKLTTSKYCTPNGTNIHGIGIEPNIKVEFDGEQYSMGIDNQLEAAVKELMKGVG